MTRAVYVVEVDGEPRAVFSTQVEAMKWGANVQGGAPVYLRRYVPAAAKKRRARK